MAFGTISVDNITFENAESNDQTVTVQSLVDKPDAASPTFTGTVTAPTLDANVIFGDNTDVGTGTSLALDDASSFRRTVNGDVTLTFDDPPATGNGFSFILEVIYTSGTITWPAACEWPGGDAAPTLTANRTSLFMFYTRNAGTTWFGSILQDYDLS